jgi:hypothetical protein
MINRLPNAFGTPMVNGSAVQQPQTGIVADIPQRIIQEAARCIGKYPVASLGAAFLAGMVLGRVVKR